LRALGVAGRGVTRAGFVGNDFHASGMQKTMPFFHNRKSFFWF
jgi:hypothetical protein